MASKISQNQGTAKAPDADAVANARKVRAERRAAAARTARAKADDAAYVALYGSGSES
jgi:hypothetical protein